MFAKSFRVKSNSAIKGSDRRKLRADVQAALSLSADQLSRLVPNKEDMNVVKMYLHKGEAVTVYVLNKNPIFFEMDKKFYPTVYALWTCPELLVSFTTWPAVLPKLVAGADLMLPGVILPPAGLPEVLQGDLCAITLVDNRAPVAIGLANMSTAEMLEAGMKGKGITTLHTYLDQLWAFGEKTHPPVIAAEHNYSEETGNQEEVEEEVAVEAVGVENVTAMLPGAEGDAPDLNSLSLNVEPEPDPVASPTEQDSNSELEALENVHLTEISKDADSQQDAAEIIRTTQEQMDEILLQCFLHALKRKVKKADLPLLASTFLKNHMYPCCPEGRTLDVKKSSYKKLSKFLQSMQQKQIIQVKEFSKGVESIAAVNWDHADLKSFVIAETATGDEVMATEMAYRPPEISSFYCVSSRLLPLFEHAGLEKDATLSSVDVRNIIISYVKSNDLIDACNKNYVIVNPTLCDCILEKSEHHTVTKLKWDDLFARCLERLQECHQVTFPGQKPIIRKGCIKHIIIDVAQRASNKKITLIKNLEVYGIDPQVIGNALQLRAQASVTLNPIPGTKDKMVLQVQGNQVNHVAKLLTEEYSIPSKYIQGLNKAPKSVKKKR